MKLTCDSCSAKYSIADDRVAGKLFKIRCKKCSHVIIVRGTALAAPPVTEPPPPPPSGEWHAVVNGEQIGPFDRTELVRRREERELDDDTYVWREGMTDWVPLGTVDEFSAQPPAVATVEVGDAMRLRNERNETSVLFTLGNLARLASQPQQAKPAAAAGSTSGPVEEGSGLIDIRALASTWAQPSATAKLVGATAIGPLDDLPAYAPINIADPIVLVPTNHHRGTDRRLLVALVAMLAMIATLATVLVIVLTRDGGTAQAAVSPAPVVTAPEKIETPPPPPAPAPAPQVMLKPTTPTPPPPIATTTPPKTRTRPTKTTTPAKVATPSAEDPDGCSQVSCMVNDNAGNCCDRWTTRKVVPATTPPPGDLPDNLDRAALGKGIATIKAQKCGASSSAKGDVNVSVKVTPEGTVSGVTIKSTPDQALAACVVAEAKRGTFAKTKRGGSFSYFWRF